MPVDRTLVAAAAGTSLERVRAGSHGSDWGALHAATQRRFVLPGAGEVQWRSWDELLFVDAMTAFRLEPGESYQLRHEGERDHLVLCSAAASAPKGRPRAWLVAPRELFGVMCALRGVQRGDAALAALSRRAGQALARSQPLHPAGAGAVMRGRQVIARHACAELSLEELGEAVRCSPSHLTRLFRRELGTPPHQYRLGLRLALALRHLQAGEKDLAALAHGLGFSSQSHFGDAFRRGVGCTPAEARGALA